MRYATFMLSVGLAAMAIVALGVGPTSAESTSGAAPFLASGSMVDTVIGSGSSGLVVPVHKKGFSKGFGHRGFRGGFYWGYPGYSFYGGYPLEYNPSPSTTCVWNGYQYTCYNFPSESSSYRIY